MGDDPSSGTDGLSRRNAIAGAAADLLVLSSGVGCSQIVHGAIWGRLSPVNYLQGTVDGDTLRLELKEFPVSFSGDHIWHVNRSKENRPRETLTVPDRVKQEGPSSVGTLVHRGNEDVTRTGHFA